MPVPIIAITDTMTDVCWTPCNAQIRTTKMYYFIQEIAGKYNIAANYHALHKWSCDELACFWGEIWNLAKIMSSQDYERVVDISYGMCIPTKWFEGSLLNYAENILERGSESDIAIIQFDEKYEACRYFSRKDLKLSVKRLTAFLASKGVQKGAVIAAYAANSFEVAVYSMAAAALGAIFTSISADFGTEAVIDRFKQTSPLALLVSSSVVYNGKVHSQNQKILEILKGTPVIVDNYSECTSINLCIVIEKDHSLPGAVSFEETQFTNIDSFEYAQLPFDHPLYILYSSGTTGNPKCIVHSAGGTLIQHLKEHILHGDVRPGDKFFQFTSIGWMMWHWSLSVLGVGATLIIYDGSPLKPDANSLWDRLGSLNVTHFGGSARYFISLEEMKFKPDALLNPLRVIFSTGSPLPASAFGYIYGNIKKDVQLSSITGGTDIISLFCGGNPMLSVHAGEIQCACLGMKVEAFSETGMAVEEGSEGDMVCTRSFPAMPVCFWNDPGDKLYRKSYFEKFPGAWHHGDFIKINPQTGGIVMLGRSDGTLNPRGIRFGSADLYSIMNDKGTFPWIQDSLAVGVLRGSDLDEDVYLFLKLKDDFQLDEGMKKLVKDEIKKRLSPRHVPFAVMQAPSIPYTVNGKKIEVSVKKILSGTVDLPVKGLSDQKSILFYRELGRKLKNAK